MPRHKPLVQTRPPKRTHNDFKYERDFTYCLATPCFKCSGFMFLVTVSYDHGPLYDELECFNCKKCVRLGSHDPTRTKESIERSKKSRPRFKKQSRDIPHTKYKK